MASTLVASYKRALAVTPTDGVTIPASRAIVVGATGTLTVRMDGVNVTFPTVNAGVVYLLCVDQVQATGTTATGVVALY